MAGGSYCMQSDTSACSERVVSGVASGRTGIGYCPTNIFRGYRSARSVPMGIHALLYSMGGEEGR